MKTEFALFNPANGEYTRTNTKEEALVLLAQIAKDFYFSHSHGNPVVMVSTDDNGAEVWTAPDGSNVITDDEAEAQLKMLEKHTLSFANAGEIPVTNL